MNPYESPREAPHESPREASPRKRRINWWLVLVVICVTWAILVGVLPAINSIVSDWR